MANIYNDSSAFISQTGSSSGNFTNLVAENAIIENAAIDNLNVDQTAVFNSVDTQNLIIPTLNQNDLLLMGAAGVIDGLTAGTNKDVLCVTAGIPTWQNSLELQNLKTNTLNIPTTQQGDLIVMDSSSNATRFAIGSSGQFLISDGINPTWNALPNPLILGSLQANGTIQFPNYANSNLFTDSTGFFISERPKFTQGGTQGFTTTPNQFYGSATWYMTNNAWYKIKVFMTSANSNGFFGSVKVNGNDISYFSFNGPQPRSVCVDQIYLHTGSTGIQGIALTAQTSSGISSISYYQIYLERICEPVIVL